MANEQKTKTVAASDLRQSPKAPAKDKLASAPSNLFTKPVDVKEPRNEVRVSLIKTLISEYSVEGGSNKDRDTAKQAFKGFVRGIDMVQTLKGADLRECLAFVINEFASNTNNAYGREAVFRFLPEVSKGKEFDRFTRLVNMILFYAKSDVKHFKNMVDVEYSVDLIEDANIRGQVASYFNA